MKYLFLCAHRLPHPTGNGLSVLNDGLVDCFARLGWQPIVVPVALQDTAEQERRNVQYLADRGIDVLTLSGITRRDRSLSRRVRRAVYLRDDELFPTSEEASEVVGRLVVQHRIGVLVAAGWQALALGNDVRDVYRIASLVDLIDPSIELRRQSRKWKRPIGGIRRMTAEWNLRRMSALGMRNVRRYDLVLEHAHQHAETLRHQGISNVVYVPHPISDPGPPSPRQERAVATILVAGSLKGAASLKGFEFLLDEILPALMRRKQELTRNVCVRVVGHGAMPPLLRERLVAHPLIDIAGYVDRIDDEYRECDALLVAIPVEHGFRTRIAEALSHGACVIAHAANQAGMPELRDGHDILSDTTGDGLATRIIEVVNRPSHARAIGERGYATFVREYSRERAVARLRSALPARLLV